MNKNDMVTILAGGILAFVAFKVLKPSTTTANTWKMPAGYGATQINAGDLSGTIADGWQYYTDGTAIAPNGDYYYHGQKIWSAAQ